MRILHVIEGLPRTAGTTVFPVEVAREQIACGHQVEIVHFTFNECTNSAALIRRVRTLDELGYRPDRVYIHAFWSMCQVRAMRWCVRECIPYVVSPHGGLMPRVLKKGWLKKHIFYWLFLKKNLQSAAAIHCTGEGEEAAVKALGIKTKTFIAPLGCRLPAANEVDKRGRGGEKTALFLGRLGEEKGLELLLEGWKRGRLKGWKLVIAGPSWLGYGEKLKKKVEVEKVGGVEFPGVADEVMKERLYRDADVFVLPSPMENFSMVVLDALAYGVPVICTQGTPWRVIAEKNAGWWIESNSAEAIRAALEEAAWLTDDERHQMGERGRRIAEEYSWSKIAAKMTDISGSLLCK